MAEVLKFTDIATGEPIAVRRQGTDLISLEPAEGGSKLRLDIQGQGPTTYNIREKVGETLAIFGGRAAATLKTTDFPPVAPPAEALDIEEILKNPG